MSDNSSAFEGIEKRKFKRRYIQFSVRYRFNAEGVITDWKTSHAGNMSAGGLFMTFGENLYVGRVLDLEFSLPEQNKTIRTTGRIVRVKEVIPGTMVDCGLEFTDLKEEDRQYLDAYSKDTSTPDTSTGASS
ncbi:MAG TPA: PilZ domain-containing protein [Elusimicrobiota bacterium]|nr:PilZ domain-containing protein [Elusimicrobiota bacterium]